MLKKGTLSNEISISTGFKDKATSCVVCKCFEGSYVELILAFLTSVTFALNFELTKFDLYPKTSFILWFVCDQYSGASNFQASSVISEGDRIPTLILGYPNLPTKGAGADPKKSCFSL